MSATLNFPVKEFVRFDEQRAYTLIERHLQTLPQRDSDLLGDVLEAVRPLVNSIAAFYADEFDREDVAQDILIHLIGALPSYNHNPTQLKAWLSSIIRRKAIDLWRDRTQGNPSLPLELRDEIAHIPDHDAADDSLYLPHLPALIEYMRRRFPSLPQADIDNISETILLSLMDSHSTRATIALLRSTVAAHLQGSQVMTLYGAALVYLRAMGWSPEYDELPSPQIAEFSLFPELQRFLGEDAARRLYGLFKGTSVSFRVK